MYMAYDIKSPARHPVQDPAILAGQVPVPLVPVNNDIDEENALPPNDM